MTSVAERQRKQKELDSILDAALDDLDDDSSDSGDDNDDGDAPIGVPYSPQYLASGRGERAGSSNDDAARSGRRPRFGPEPPPIDASPFPPLPPLDLPPGEAEELAASLEGMMKQFTEELGASGSNGADFRRMGGLGDAALDDMFRKMMSAEGGGGGADRHDAPAAGAPAGAAETPGSNRQTPKIPKNGSSDTNTNNAHGSSDANTSPPSSSAATTPGEKSTSSTPRKNNGTGSNNSKEPNVDESINRLLDGIDQASNDPLPNNMPPGTEDIDPTQFRQMGEEMMESIMGQFEKMGNADDGDDVVDGVMKQLLDKDLMYEPMKEVCVRFPGWLARNREDLGEDEYERYGTQYQYFQKIVRLYETEPENFARLMELMQDIQEYGQPPVEIIKDLAPELEFDAEGMPVMMDSGGGMPPGMMPAGMPFPGGAGNEQCCIS